MVFKKSIFYLFVACLLFSFGTANSQQKEKLIVSVNQFEPTVIKNPDGTFTGFEVELWEEIARGLHIDYEYIETDFAEQLRLVAEKKVDVAMSGITINSVREEKMDFSHRTLDSGLQILVRKENEFSLISFLRPICQPEVLRIVAYLSIFTLIVGYFFTQFSRAYYPDIELLDGIYWGVVVQSTVGLGDYVPKNRSGKILTIITILFGLAIFGTYIGTISGIKVIEHLKTNISEPSGLRGKNVATVENTTSVDALRVYGVVITTTKDLAEAYDLLVNKKEVDAVVFDAPCLNYYVNRAADGKAVVVGSIFDRQDYGFAFPEGSQLREKVNRILLRLQETGVYNKLHVKYFGTK